MKTYVRSHNNKIAGIIPTCINFQNSFRNTDLYLPFDHWALPINKNYIAIERSITECINAGCRTIWIVCSKDTKNIIRYRLGDYVRGYKTGGQYIIYPEKHFYMDGNDSQQISIPIYYILQHPTDKLNKRTNIIWQVIYGAWRVYQITTAFSYCFVPDKYYITFPTSITQPIGEGKNYKKHRSLENVFISAPFEVGFKTIKKYTIKDDKLLPFSITHQELKIMKDAYYLKEEEYRREDFFDKQENKSKPYYYYFSDIMKDIEIKNIIESPWFYDIRKWANYTKFLLSQEGKKFHKPLKVFPDSKWLSNIGVDYEEEMLEPFLFDTEATVDKDTEL